MAIIKWPSAPQGYGKDTVTGNFAKLPEETTPLPVSDTSRHIKDTETELSGLQNQRDITTTTVPRGTIERGGVMYTVDDAGNMVPLGGEFSSAINTRQINDNYVQQQVAHGRRIDLELEQEKEKEGRSLTQELSTERGTQGVTKGLGFSSTEMGILSGIEDRSTRRIKDLEREAEKAKIDFNFKLMEEKRAEIKDERDRTRAREQTLFDRLFKLKETEKMEKKEATQKAAYSYMNSLPTEATARDAKIKEIADAQGLDFDAFKTQLNAIQFERGKEIWAIAKDLPVGQSTTLPDGTIITGKEPTKLDINDYKVKDSTGTYIVGLDKNTGKQLYRTKIGSAGDGDGTKSDVAGMTQDQLSLVVADVESIRGGDGLLDTLKYSQVRAELGKVGKEALAWLDTAYPPEQNLNPIDATARRFFRGAPGSEKVTATPKQEAQNMKDQGMNADAIEANLTDRKFTSAEIKQAMNEVFPKEEGGFWSGLFDWSSRVQK